MVAARDSILEPYNIRAPMQILSFKSIPSSWVAMCVAINYAHQISGDTSSSEGFQLYSFK